MDKISREHFIAVICAFFVTVLWSSSWVIMKFGLEVIPPLMFAGLRYSIASLILIVMLLSDRNNIDKLKQITKANWLKLLIYGFIFITLTQGAQILGIYYLRNSMVSIFLNFTSILVLVLSIFILKEIPTRIQVIFILLALFGVIIYFNNETIIFTQFIAIFIVLLGVVSNAFSSILGRIINKEMEINSVTITTVSMAFGSIFLLFGGIFLEVLPTLSILSIFYIFWLSIVNTAIAFTLWNYAMKYLRAIDITLINSTMLPQIAILSQVFHVEDPLSMFQWFGLALISFSILIIQVDQSRRKT